MLFDNNFNLVKAYFSKYRQAYRYKMLEFFQWMFFTLSDIDLPQRLLISEEKAVSFMRARVVINGGRLKKRRKKGESEFSRIEVESVEHYKAGMVAAYEYQKGFGTNR